MLENRQNGDKCLEISNYYELSWNWYIRPNPEDRILDKNRINRKPEDRI